MRIKILKIKFKKYLEEKNGYTNKGKKNVLIREIMTKISHDIVIQELDELGAI